MKTFSLKTKSGSWHLFLLLLALILLFSFVAQEITSCGGRVKVEKITLDCRGAVLEGDLYYPAGVNSHQKLPGVIVAHGAGVNKGNYKAFAEELARRDFVVLNVNGYGTSGSEMPPYDEYEQGQDAFNMWGTSSGLYDALNFMRTLNIVDQTRLGFVGHSQGSFRAEYASMLDCSYLTLNDILLNVLYETFGVEISEEDILRSADDIAAEKLNADQLAYYEAIRAEKQEWYDTRVSSILILGTSGSHIVPRQTVEVGGHEVLRNCQINIGIICGTFDSTAFVTKDYALDSYFVSDQIATDTWYAVDDVQEKSKVVGTINDSVASNEALRAAIDARQARFVTFNVETHSKNFFSVATTADSTRFVEQTLKYNRGDLLGEAHPIDAYNTVFVWRELCNFAAMLAMLGMIVALASILYKTSFFAPCQCELPAVAPSFSKKRIWLCNLASVLIGFVCMYQLNKVFAPFLTCNDTFPWWPVFWLGPIFLCYFAIGSLLQLGAYTLLDRKTYGWELLKAANVKMSFVNILKTLLAAFLLVLTAYGTLAMVKYLFNQDFRLWMFAFDELKVEYWGCVLTLCLFCFLQFLPIGAALNYARRSDMPEWLDELLTVIIASLGVWLVAIINILVLHAGHPQFSAWQFSYQFLFAVPVTVYIARRLYKVSGSVWLGAFVNGLILGWSFAGPAGYNLYHAQSIFSIFFHA